MANISKLTAEMNHMLPDVVEFSKNLPELGQNGARTMETVVQLSEEINKVMPSLLAVVPQLPEASQKSVEALKEAVIVLKAMQKSWLLKGAVQDVKEEEAVAEKERRQKLEQDEKERLPANE
jgi:ABC-type transporter Mla subunit MlaD